MKPDLKHERGFWAEGIEVVCGIDEVGRGSWAGPLYVAAVIFDKGHRMIKGVDDSKKVPEKKREELSEEIMGKCLDFSYGFAQHFEVDNYGLTLATNIAIERAVKSLRIFPQIVLMDGMKIDYKKIKALPIKKGDQVCYSISCASILAKVERDKFISNIPEAEIYNFGKNKGYGTVEHIELIKKHGISDVHRKSFKPIKVLCG